MGSSTNERAAIDKVRQLLHRRLKVVLVGGRVLLGDLQCLDKQGNLILGNTVEQLSHIQDSQGNERTMGTVLVPKEHQQQVHVMVTLSEKASMISLVC